MIDLLSSKISDYRYERKFVVDNDLFLQLNPVIQSHPAVFKPIFYKRQINNVYFDSFHFQSYKDNVNGLSKRLKVRIRWYGDTFGQAASPNLEFKLKVNHQIGKITFALPAMNVENGYDVEKIKRVISGADLPGPIRNYVLRLSPVLLNSYQREYYRSADLKFRLTVDEYVKMYRLRNYSNTFIDQSSMLKSKIIELKYSCKYDQDSHRVTSLFPFRLSKNSKYVRGIQSMWGFYE